MKKLLVIIMIIIIFAGCTSKPVEPKEDELLLNFIIEADNIYRVDFVSYLNGKYLRMGGFADSRKKALKGADDIYISYSHEDIELNSQWDNSEPFEGTLTFELHLYDKNEDEFEYLEGISLTAQTGVKKTFTLKPDSEGRIICEVN